MPFHIEDSPKIGGAFKKAQIILLWALGITVGLSYLILPSYLFWVLLALFLMFVVTYKNIEYGYYLTVLLLPLDRTRLEYTFPDSSGYNVWILPYRFSLCFTLLVWLLSKAWKREGQGRTTPIGGLLSFMVLYMLISLLWAPQFHSSYLLAVLLLLNLSLFFLTKAVIIDEEALQRAVLALIAMGLVFSTGVIVSLWYSYDYRLWLSPNLYFVSNFGQFKYRPAGFGSSDFVCGLLVLSIFMSLGLIMISKRPAKRFLLSLAVAYQVVAVILTVSRGGFVALIAGLILLFIMHPSAKGKILKYSFLSVLLLMLTILVLKPGYIDRILVGLGHTGELYFTKTHTSVTGGAVEAASIARRSEMWKQAFKNMLDHPYRLILGLGLGGFISLPGVLYTHSVILSFFFDMGLVGVIILIILATILLTNFSHYIRGARHTNSYYIFIAAVAAFVGEVGIHGLVDYDLYSITARMFWFPLAFVCATLNVMMSENPEL